MPGKVIIIGPAYPLRGGLATFDQRLCKQFMDEGYDCSIYSFSLQYPGFLFPGTTQYSSDPPPENLIIHSRINSVNPFNWLSTGKELRRLKPDLIVVRYWLPFMGPALGTILRQVRKNNHTRIVAITDNVIPHEKRPGDRPFTRYFLKSCDAFVTMSEKVMNDLRQFEATKPARQVLHPLYDNFGEAIPKAAAREKLGLPAAERIILFFGFIRPYKGLDILLEAMKELKERSTKDKVGSTKTEVRSKKYEDRSGKYEVESLNSAPSPPHSQSPIPNSQSPIPRLLVAGEFYDNKEAYEEQIDRLGIRDLLLLHTDFIPDSAVRDYLCAADVVIQPYRNATQSGVTPLAYHFEKPMIVTNVGSLPALVPHEKSGLVCEPTPASLADAIERYFLLGENHFIPHLRSEKEKYSWNRLTAAIRELAEGE